MASLAEVFARSIADRDHNRVHALLAEGVNFKAMTPGRFWEADHADAVIDIIFGHWFEPTDVITQVLATDGDTIADRERLSYRLAGHNADGAFVVEQQAYLHRSAVDGPIDILRMMCSGFRPS